MAEGSSTTPARDRPLACVVMAGGKGTRMRSARPKLAHTVCGRPILGWVLEAVSQAGAATFLAVIPPAHEEVAAIAERYGQVAIQPEPRGTGDAVRCGLEALGAFEGDVLVVSGDTPLIRPELLVEIVAHHREAGAAATLLSVLLADAAAYGRVVRAPDGSFERIVEARDATPGQLALGEINAGLYVFDATSLRAGLAALRPENAQGELYLPDALAPIRAAGGRIVVLQTADEDSTRGINTRVELADADRRLRLRLLEGHMLAGATIVDPASTFVEADVQLDPDCVIHPFTVLRGTTRIEAGAEVGPHAVVVDSHVGAGARVGPFCYLRPGVELAAGAKAGTFVEMKNATVGEGAKVPHLSYIGDADIGEGANIGAGTITANYHRGRKMRTVIGAHARTGSDNVFVAPVKVGEGAYTGAGSIITEDVPPDALAVARARQVNIDGYARRDRDD